MKQTKRFLAFLMAFVMLMSVLVFSTSANGVSSNVADNNYDETAKIVLSTNQYSTLIVDVLDDMLKSGGTVLDIGELLGSFLPGLGQGYKLDLTSVDDALNSLNTIWKGLGGTVGSLLPIFGNNGNLNLSYVRKAPSDLNSATLSRADGDDADTKILQAILDILEDPQRTSSGVATASNPGILGKLVNDVLAGGNALQADLGATVWGIVKPLLGSTIDLTDLKGTLLEMVYGMLYPDQEPSADDLNLDDMVQGLLGENGLLAGMTLTDALGNEFSISELTAGIDIRTNSMYGIIETVLPRVYSKILLPMLEVQVTPLIQDVAAQYGFDKYLKSTITYPTWAQFNIGANDTIITRLNYIAGLFVGAFFDLAQVGADVGKNVTWVSTTAANDNEANLVNNICTIGKAVLTLFGEDIFPNETLPDYYATKYDEPTAFVGSLARTIVNMVLPYVYVPETYGENDEAVDSLYETLNYTLIELAGDTIPERYQYYVDTFLSDVDAMNSFDTSKELLSDFLTKLLYFEVDTNVYYDRSVIGAAQHATVTAAGVNSLRYADTL
ncbi:MAG: hypothetical protein LBQ33_07195, partial [Oscillospiraceae bacterium]|nr:hypothetical protein [Oscillospiraceae bacterium]